jgi:hypothetical protein
MRFAPLFPFLIGTLVTAFFCKLRTYAFPKSIFFDILLGKTIYLLFAAGLRGILDQGESFSVGSILTPIFLFAIIVLTALSLAAIPIRKRHRGLSITEVTSRGL